MLKEQYYTKTKSADDTIVCPYVNSILHNKHPISQRLHTPFVSVVFTDDEAHIYASGGTYLHTACSGNMYIIDSTLKKYVKIKVIDKAYTVEKIVPSVETCMVFKQDPSDDIESDLIKNDIVLFETDFIYIVEDTSDLQEYFKTRDFKKYLESLKDIEQIGYADLYGNYLNLESVKDKDEILQILEALIK